MSHLEYSPGLADVPVAESAISFIDGKRARLEYRGIAVETLARESCFEETAWLLLRGQLPTQRELADFDDLLRHRRRIKYKLKDLIKCLPETGHPMDALQASVAAMGMFYPARDISSPDNNWDSCIRLIAKLPTVVAAFHRLRHGDEAITPRDDLDHAANFYYMLFEREPSPAVRKILDACLILHAEHTMNASTFSGRVTASTLAKPDTVISSAIGTLTGPLHGGANEEVLDMLEEIGSTENVRPWLEAAVSGKKKIMGFGHRIYKVKDPRASVLQELAEHVFAETTRPRMYELAMELEREAAGILGPKGIYPNVDFYSGIVYQALGIPRDLFTPIFAIARVAGWLAHWLEQLKNNRIFRPEQVYMGKHDIHYVPLEKRHEDYQQAQGLQPLGFEWIPLMLDAQFIREHLEEVKTNCRNRNVTADVDRVVQLDDERKRLVQETQVLQQQRNEQSKSVGKEKDPVKKQALVQEGRLLRDKIADLESRSKQVETELKTVLLTIPNMSHPHAPVGTTAEDNKVIHRWGEPRTFDFPVKDHVALGEALDLVDFEAGSTVAGPKFYFLKNEAVLLELALVQFAMGVLVREGYTPIITPDVARVEVLEGIGFIPRGPETQIYSLENTDLCLIATAEITLGGMHRDKVMEEKQLPLKYAGLSHCFRTEAGAPGRDMRGLYRVHQFTKVEMFVFSTSDQSEAIHQELLAIEEKIFQALGLPYHVIDTCTGDLGGPAYRKYDLEAWMPGRGQGGEYGEVTSTSNCTDYQARRLNIRYKAPGQKGTRFVHTLNGTAVAVSRALVAILEDYQEADGSVTVPEVLRPWVGKERIGPSANR